MLSRILLAAATCLAMTCGPAAAQTFKAPIRIVVPQAPGGGTDVVARLLAPGLSKELGQTVVIENKPGASGQIGAQFVQNAPPDGTVVLFAVDHTMLIVPVTVPGVRFDALTDFVPLGQAYRTYWALTVPMNAEYKDFAGYLASLRREPLLRSFGVPLTGGAPTIIGNAVGTRIGVPMVEVPFAGSAPVMQNVMAGQLPAGITGLPEAMRVHRGGLARTLAVSGANRTALLPDVPTFRELGLEGLDFYTFNGFFAPKGFPAPMAQAFNAALRKALADPMVQDRFRDMSLAPAPTTLAEAAAEISEQGVFWKKTFAPAR